MSVPLEPNLSQPMFLIFILNMCNIRVSSTANPTMIFTFYFHVAGTSWFSNLAEICKMLTCYLAHSTAELVVEADKV